MPYPDSLTLSKKPSIAMGDLPVKLSCNVLSLGSSADHWPTSGLRAPGATNSTFSSPFWLCKRSVKLSGRDVGDAKEKPVSFVRLERSARKRSICWSCDSTCKLMTFKVGLKNMDARSSPDAV